MTTKKKNKPKSNLNTDSFAYFIMASNVYMETYFGIKSATENATHCTPSNGRFLLLSERRLHRGLLVSRQCMLFSQE